MDYSDSRILNVFEDSMILGTMLLIAVILLVARVLWWIGEARIAKRPELRRELETFLGVSARALQARLAVSRWIVALGGLGMALGLVIAATGYLIYQRGETTALDLFFENTLRWAVVWDGAQAQSVAGLIMFCMGLFLFLLGKFVK